MDIHDEYARRAWIKKLQDEGHDDAGEVVTTEQWLADSKGPKAKLDVKRFRDGYLADADADAAAAKHAEEVARLEELVKAWRAQSSLDRNCSERMAEANSHIQRELTAAREREEKAVEHLRAMLTIKMRVKDTTREVRAITQPAYDWLFARDASRVNGEKESCHHTFVVSSPIDTEAVCSKCGEAEFHNSGQDKIIHL